MAAAPQSADSRESGTGTTTPETSAQQSPPTTSTAQTGTRQALSGKGAQFIYSAATVANILCDNLSPTQINLLANFLSVVTTCVYAILTVEFPNEIIEG